MTAHVRLIKEYGGGIGVRDVGLIESALHHPLTSFGGRLKYGNRLQRAAILWLALIRNHGFVDGNKRTASAAMARWLLLEGLQLSSEQDDLVEMAVAIANKRVQLEGVVAWLEKHTKRARRGGTRTSP